MEKSTPKYKVAVVSLALCTLCVGLALFATGCVIQPPCMTDADCDDGLFCNGAETCVDEVCQDGTNPCEEGQDCDEDNAVCVVEGCQSNEDCPEGEVCDVQTAECFEPVNLYATTRFDTDKDTVHMAPSGHVTCTACHHAADDEAGVPAAAGQACVACHADDPNEFNSFKSVAHDSNASGDGCYLCHADEIDNDCGYCHPDAP